jgi:hypothetical protein
MRARIAALLPLLASLGACAGGVPVQQEVIVSGTKFADIQGEARLTVRSYVEDAEGARNEVLGAECDVITSLYTARLVTPARLVVPNFGPQSPELRFDCRAADLRGTALRPVTTTWQYPPGYLATPYPFAYGRPGAYGWGGGGWYGPGWYGPGYPVSRYPDVFIRLD